LASARIPKTRQDHDSLRKSINPGLDITPIGAKDEGKFG
jgi:hypothetical protein